LLNTLERAVERYRLFMLAAQAPPAAREGVIFETPFVGPGMPYTLGDSELDEELIDLAIEAPEDLLSPEARPGHEHAERIAELVADLVENGSTLQLGISQVPDATLRALAGRRNLAIWSEMILDGVMHLDRLGALDRARPIACSFLFGSSELYAWVDRNPRLRMTRTETINNPSLIAAHPAMVSINTALQVDLHDQASASHIAGRLYSGFGGQPRFRRGRLALARRACRDRIALLT
jgi:acyl-CoA hydrolase